MLLPLRGVLAKQTRSLSLHDQRYTSFRLGEIAHYTLVLSQKTYKYIIQVADRQCSQHQGSASQFTYSRIWSSLFCIVLKKKLCCDNNVYKQHPYILSDHRLKLKFLLRPISLLISPKVLICLKKYKIQNFFGSKQTKF